jgi:multiple sugar transport system substrate-binding protein
MIHRAHHSTGSVARRRTTALTALSLSAVLAGTVGVSAVSAQSPSAPAQDAVSGDISFFGWDAGDLTQGLGLGFETARQSFQGQNPGTNITFDVVPFGDFVSAATTRARAGTLGDVVEMLPGLNHAPVFDALTPTTKADWGALGDELTGWSGGVIDPADPDTYAGVPIGGQGVSWYYNKALFEQAGLDPEQPPTTWAEFTAAADALKAAGITPVAASGADSVLAWWAWSSFSPQYFSADDVLGIRAGTIPLDDPRVLASLQPIADMYAAGYWPADYADKKFTDEAALFGDGKVAMIPGVITSVANWKQWDGAAIGPDGYGVFGAPKRDDATSDGQFFNPTLIYGINAASKNPDLAKAFVSFLAGTEGQSILLAQSGQFPNRGDVDLAQYASPGAVAIQGVIDTRGATDVIQNQFSAAAQGDALQKLTQAVVSGDLAGFLSGLQAQQGS